jgi:hypothetical protein
MRLTDLPRMKLAMRQMRGATFASHLSLGARFETKTASAQQFMRSLREKGIDDLTLFINLQSVTGIRASDIDFRALS